MSEQKTIERGQWWFSNDRQTRCYICGFDPDGDPVFLTEPTLRPDTDTMVDFLACWHHEPRCNSWEWQPEPEPEWFDLTAMDVHVLRTPIDHVSKGGRFAEVDGLSGATVGFAKRQGYTQFRCLLKDAPKIVKTCNGCGKPLLPENAWMTDGCPCNSPAGVNSEHSSSVEVYHRYVTPLGQEFWARNTGETREVVR